MSISTFLRIVVYAMAVFRFTMLLVEEDGPWRIFTRFRLWAGIGTHIVLVENDEGEHMPQVQTILSDKAGFFAEMLMCPFCTSGWLSIWATVGVWMEWWAFDVVAVWGCIWGIVAYIFKRLDY